MHSSENPPFLSFQLFDHWPQLTTHHLLTIWPSNVWFLQFTQKRTFLLFSLTNKWEHYNKPCFIWAENSWAYRRYFSMIWQASKETNPISAKEVGYVICDVRICHVWYVMLEYVICDVGICDVWCIVGRCDRWQMVLGEQWSPIGSDLQATTKDTLRIMARIHFHVKYFYIILTIGLPKDEIFKISATTNLIN